MTQEEKQLLLVDLCARLPYGVKVCARFNTGNRYTANITAISADRDYVQIRQNDLHPYTSSSIEDIRPYLRPMSSMTEEEKEYIKNRWCYNDWDIDGPSSLWREKIDVEDAEGIIDYFNEHHLDYRGLIPIGLALEAPKGMYKDI